MTVAATTEAGARPVRAGRRPRLPAWLGTLPFFGYVGVFLLLPTGILIVDAFKNPSGSWNFGSLSTLYSPAVRDYFIGSFKLCVLSAVAGAVFGALVAYAVASGKPDGMVRRLSVAGSGVLAQFGGVTLAFAFQALIGPAGLLFHAGWYYSFPWGIRLIYTYFQIPLMVLVFLPAIDGLKVQWREASESLGCSTWQYWWHMAARCSPRPSSARHCCCSPTRCPRSPRSWPGRTRSLTPCPSRSTPRCPARWGWQRQRGRHARVRHDRHGGDRHDRVCAAAAEGGPMAAVTSIGETPLAGAAARGRRACSAAAGGG